MCGQDVWTVLFARSKAFLTDARTPVKQDVWFAALDALRAAMQETSKFKCARADLYVTGQRLRARIDSLKAQLRCRNAQLIDNLKFQLDTLPTAAWRIDF